MVIQSRLSILLIIQIIFGLLFFSENLEARDWKRGERDWNIEADAQLGIEKREFPDVIGKARATETWLTSSMDFSLKNGLFRRWFFSARLVGQFLIDGPSDTWNQSGSSQYLEDQELSLEYSYRGHRFRLGTTSVRWGILDLFDPLDQVNSKRFENPLAPEKRGDPMLLWMFSSSGQQVSQNFEFFYAPRKRRSILPSETSAWLPRQIYVPNLTDTEFVLPDSLSYKYSGYEELDECLSHIFGVRIVLRQESTEVALQYDEGASAFPNVRPEVTGTIVAVPPQSERTRIKADPLIRLSEIYYRERHFGGSITTSAGTSLVRLQIAKTERLYGGRGLARDRTDISIGLENAIGKGTLLTQLYYNIFRLEQDNASGAGNDLASMSSLFDRALGLGIRFPFGDSSSLLFGGLYSKGSKDENWTTIGLSTIALSLTDYLTMNFSLQLIHSGPQGPLAPFANNDGGAIKMIAIF